MLIDAKCNVDLANKVRIPPAFGPAARVRAVSQHDGWCSALAAASLPCGAEPRLRSKARMRGTGGYG